MDDLLDNLNPEQREAVTHGMGPLMIIAGAGTGKTTVISKRIAWLIREGKAKPEEIVALTFTEKAAAEMEERVDLLLPYGYVDLSIFTFHAFCERLLREYGQEIGLSPQFDLVDELDAWLLARQHFDRFSLDYYRPAGNPTKYLKGLLQHFSRAKDELISPDQYVAYAEGRQADFDVIETKGREEGVEGSEAKRLVEIAGAYATYQCILREHDALDFGDIILCVHELLQKRPAVLQDIRRRFPYVLVDEFQDTNFAQYEIVKKIAAPLNNLTVVGDDDQSIYKFRGASLSNILQFEEDFPTSHRVILTKNYRSHQKILDRAYQFIQANNPNRLEARLPESGKDALNKRLVSERAGEGIVEHLHFVDTDAEASGVIEMILSLKKQFPEANWSDFAILFRANASAEPFIESFEQAGIPYQFLALRGLYAKPLILDMIAVLEVLHNPYVSPSLYRVLTHAWLEISPEDIVQLTHEAKRKALSLYDTCSSIRLLTGISVSTIEKVESLLSFLRECMQESKRRHVSDLFLFTVKRIGLMNYLTGLSERQKQESFRYLQQFYERLKRFERRHADKTLGGFLEEFHYEREAGEAGALSTDMESGPDVVKLMTVHGSKGLEFRFVFVVHVVDRRFPSQERSEAIELPLELVPERLPEGDHHLEEERRLFYVAMTRAKDGLFFTSADDYGGSRRKKLSRFLHELGYVDSASTELKKQDDTLTLPEPSSSLLEEGDPMVFSLPAQLSFTQLTAFETCPLQYKFAHLFRIPVLGKWNFSFGQTVHLALQQWVTLWMERQQKPQLSLFGESVDMSKKSIPVTPEELIGFYEKAWIDEWYPDESFKKECREKGRAALYAYAVSQAHSVPKPLCVEKAFTLKIGSVTLIGRIDRIDACEDGVEIIDYKTGVPKQEDDLTWDHKRQLLLYHIAVQEIFGWQPKKLTFQYLENNSTVRFTATPKDIDRLKEEIQEVAATMSQSDFAATPGFHCRFCDFADICNFRQNT